MQTSSHIDDIPKLGKAASRLLRVMDHFWKTSSYQPESLEAVAEAAAESAATEDPDFGD